jgi:hypothetical protein
MVITTEGVLIGNIIGKGLSENLVIVSDDAGQFNVLLHADSHKKHMGLVSCSFDKGFHRPKNQQGT